MRKPVVLCGLLGLLVTTSCKGTIDRRVDPDSPDAVGGTGLQSQDIRTMARQMADGIRASGVLTARTANQEKVTFHITEMQNRSSDPMDSTIILMSLRSQLFEALGGKVRVLDRSADGLEAVRREREAKRAAAVTANPERRGDVLGSDYVLKGVIQDRVLQSNELKSAYYLVTFELTDLETSELVWVKSYETKFESDRSVISR